MVYASNAKDGHNTTCTNGDDVCKLRMGELAKCDVSLTPYGSCVCVNPHTQGICLMSSIDYLYFEFEKQQWVLGIRLLLVRVVCLLLIKMRQLHY